MKWHAMSIIHWANNTVAHLAPSMVQTPAPHYIFVQGYLLVPLSLGVLLS